MCLECVGMRVALFHEGVVSCSWAGLYLLSSATLGLSSRVVAAPNAYEGVVLKPIEWFSEFDYEFLRF